MSWFQSDVNRGCKVLELIYFLILGDVIVLNEKLAVHSKNLSVTKCCIQDVQGIELILASFCLFKLIQEMKQGVQRICFCHVIYLLLENMYELFGFSLFVKGI